MKLNNKKFGLVVGLAVIALALALGIIAFYNMTPEQEFRNEIRQIETQETSDEPEDIEEDLRETEVENIDKELEDIEAEINASY